MTRIGISLVKETIENMDWHDGPGSIDPIADRSETSNQLSKD